MYERIWSEECILYGVKGAFCPQSRSKSIFPRDSMDIDELRAIVKGVQEDAKLPLEEVADGWLYWFSKRGERVLKDAAKLGYMEVTLDLPIEIAASFHEPALIIIRNELRKILRGFTVGFVEDEYRGERLCRVLVSWG
jgi:hypothetical protein